MESCRYWQSPPPAPLLRCRLLVGRGREEPDFSGLVYRRYLFAAASRCVLPPKHFPYAGKFSMDATPAVLPARHLDMLPLIRRTSGLAEAHQPIHASQRGHRPGPGAFAGPGVNMHVEWENGRGSAKGKGEETRATKESNLEGGKSGCFSRVLQRYLASPASTAVVSRKSTRADRPLTHTLTPHGGKLSGCSAMTTSQPSSPSLPLPPFPQSPQASGHQATSCSPATSTVFPGPSDGPTRSA